MKMTIGKATMIAAALSLGACGSTEKEEKIEVYDLGPEFAAGSPDNLRQSIPEGAIVRFEFDTKTGKTLSVGQTAPISAMAQLSDDNIDTVYNSAKAESIASFSSADSFPSSNYCPQSAQIQTSYYNNNSCGIDLPPVVNPTTVQNQSTFNNRIVNDTTYNNTDIYKRTVNTVNVHDLGSTTRVNYVPSANQWNFPQAQVGQFNFGCQSNFCQNQNFGIGNGFNTGLNNWNTAGGVWAQGITNNLRPVTYYNAGIVNQHLNNNGALPLVAGYPLLNIGRAVANRVRRYRAAPAYSRLYVPQTRGNVGVGYATYCRTNTCNFLR